MGEVVGVALGSRDGPPGGVSWLGGSAPSCRPAAVGADGLSLSLFQGTSPQRRT